VIATRCRLLPPAAWAVLLLLFAGCATPPKLSVGPDPALFARTAAATATKVAGRVALWVPPQVAAMHNVGERPLGASSDLRIPIGRIVEQAVQLALGDALAGGVESVAAMPAAGAGHLATLVLDAVRGVDRSRILWLLPVPILGVIGDTEFDVQVAIDMRLLDAQGRTVWTHRYDSGRAVWQRPAGSGESASAGIVRLTHEAAWRLAQQAVAELREWLEAERLRPREL